MSRWYQAITGVEFSPEAATQGATSRQIGNYEWRTCERSLRGPASGFEPSTFRTEHHHSTTTPLNNNAIKANRPTCGCDDVHEPLTEFPTKY